MITGYNHNIKYKDQVVHIQTEDSGLENPHIITHLFIGGNIIRSSKSSYADHVGAVDIEPIVVKMMQAQHKAMLKSLIKGQLDAELQARGLGAGKLDGPAPLNVEAGAQERASLGFGGVGAPDPGAVAPPPPAAPADGGAAAALVSSFFGSAPPPEQIIEAETLQRAFDSNDDSAVDSIFGEDLISEKSLDEVILSYLAEDMSKE